MKIKYQFSNGEITEVEVTEEIGSLIIESRKAEHAQNERQRYHCPYSIDALLFEGMDYAAKGKEDGIDDETRSRVKFTFSKLTPLQQQRLALYAGGLSMREIAARENVHHSVVEESIKSARKKFMKFF